MQKKKAALLATAGAILGTACLLGVLASDHDDGETDVKSRALNLTDLYVFREDGQTNNGGDASNLIFITFEFGAPDAANQQDVAVTATLDGVTHVATARSDNGMAIQTTDLRAAGTPFFIRRKPL